VCKTPVLVNTLPAFQMDFLTKVVVKVLLPTSHVYHPPAF